MGAFHPELPTQPSDPAPPLAFGEPNRSLSRRPGFQEHLGRAAPGSIYFVSAASRNEARMLKRVPGGSRAPGTSSRLLPPASRGECASYNIPGRSQARRSQSAGIVRAFGRAFRRRGATTRLRPLWRTGFNERARLWRWQSGRFVERQLFGSRCHDQSLPGPLVILTPAQDHS